MILNFALNRSFAFSNTVSVAEATKIFLFKTNLSDFPRKLGFEFSGDVLVNVSKMDRTIATSIYSSKG